MNSGGTFYDSGQTIGNSYSYYTALGDLDADGDLDAFVTGSGQANRVWLNSAGLFTDSGQALGDHESTGVSLGDLDGDGDLDAFSTTLAEGHRIWINQAPTISVLPQSLILLEGDSGTTTFAFTVERLFDTRGTVTVDYAFAPSSSSPAQPDDFVGGVLPAGTLTFADGISSLPLSIEVVGDTTVEDNEEFSLTLSNVSGAGAVLGNAVATARIRNDDALDFGDLPAPFPTLLADNGPTHNGVGPLLGTIRDTEQDGFPSANADGDDTDSTPDDEDGVAFAAGIFAGQTAAAITVEASSAARLDAWIDFDGDRSFSGPAEQIFSSQVVAAGDNLLTFAVPADARQGRAFARFRLSTAGGLSPGGAADDGEVEDHVVEIQAPRGSGQFVDSGQSLGDHGSFNVALGDLDGDGDLDAFVANYYAGTGAANRVWFNQGGAFSDSGQTLGMDDSTSVALGDLDGDGDLDAFVTNSYEADRVWLNDGGVFADAGQSLGDHDSSGVALGDLDADGDLDAFVATYGQGHRLWMNDGGQFTDSGQTLGDRSGIGVTLGDTDGDGDLDALVANRYAGNRIWRNVGGVFSDSGQTLGNHDSFDVALGDVDSDGDLDAIVANRYEGNRVWVNDGGRFSDSGQSLGDHASLGVALGDLDGDGDLDALAGNSYEGNRIWLNDGGQFSDSGQSLGIQDTVHVALGDLDNDGDLDALAANFFEGNRIWAESDDDHLGVTIPVGLSRR